MLVPWALTIGLAGGGVCCVAGATRSDTALAVRISAAAIALMAAALIAMAWPWGMNLPVWPQVVVFALIASWFVGVSTRWPEHRWYNVHQALMAVAMIWMAVTAMVMLTPTLAVFDVIMAAYFAVTGLAWLTIGIRHRHVSAQSAGNIMMSLGMTAILLLRL